MEIKKLLTSKDVKKVEKLEGWVKSNRDSGKIGFITLNDGSTVKNIQIVYKVDSIDNYAVVKTARTGAALLVTGNVVYNEKQKENEIQATSVVLAKQSDEDFALQKKQHSMEFLRDNAHLRIRTTTMEAVTIVRNALAFSLHKFFNEQGYVWAASPIITSNDCEGAGENFVIKQDCADPFFSNEASLTVSGQLNAEALALGMKKVYTFGPTFRAEKSHTNRHLAEFWMLEPEVSFMDLTGISGVIENMIKFSIEEALNRCKDEMAFLESQKPGLIERLNSVVSKKFIRVEYKEAIVILQEAIKNGHKFEENNVEFGIDLATEHERYICEKHFNGPVFVYNYPKDIKAFYMKANDDGLTVAATDLLVPGVGEIVGGSQREDDYNKLLNRCKEMKIPIDGLSWYLDLRRYGYYKSAGYGLGFERLVMYVTGVDNIKDTIPFPRFNGGLKF